MADQSNIKSEKVSTENLEISTTKKFNIMELDGSNNLKYTSKKKLTYNLTSGAGLLIFSQPNLEEITNLVTKESPIWENYNQNELKLKYESPPLNGFDEMINLTNEGKLWKFPIDNEQGRIFRF